MRKLSWLFFAIVAAMSLALLSQHSIWSIRVLYPFWWVPLVAASIGSSLVLAASIAPSIGSGARISSVTLSGAYIMCGLAVGIVGLSGSLGLASPGWTDLLPQTMLPLAAWAYYHSSDSPEIEGGEAPKQHEEVGMSTKVNAKP